MLLQWLMVSFLIIDEIFLVLLVIVLLRELRQRKEEEHVSGGLFSVKRLRREDDMVGVPSGEGVLSEEEIMEREWMRERGIEEEDEE